MISANLNGLSETDVTVECVVGKEDSRGEFIPYDHLQFSFVKRDGDNHLFELQFKPSKPGLNFYKLRIYPYHELLSHPFEVGKMIWVSA
jgi:starch phosphorylase